MRDAVLAVSPVLKFAVIGTMFVSSWALAAGHTFGLVGKSLDDPNFVAAWQGCDEAAQQAGDRCVHIGAHGAADPRFQAQAISKALRTESLSALAISVTASDVLARALADVNIPIVTFDSPFSAPYSNLSRAYVGIDNIEFGRVLARIAKRLRPKGGTLCLMTSDRDVNLAQRVRGVRAELSGVTEDAGNGEKDLESRRLAGEGGWTELLRCPWNSADKVVRAMSQLNITLDHLHPDVFISVGHWPVIDAVAYRATASPYRANLMRKQPIVIVAVGSLSAGEEALMKDGLVHAYVSIDFKKIGRQSYGLMKTAIEGGSLPSSASDAVVIRVGQ